MILVNFDNKKLLVGLAFSHPSRLEATGVVYKDAETGRLVQETIKVRQTRCEILEIKEGEERVTDHGILAVATVRCDPRDNFCKETGRKLALKQAIHVLHPPLSKEDREWMWDRYLNRPRPKSVPKGEVLDIPIIEGVVTMKEVEPESPHNKDCRCSLCWSRSGICTCYACGGGKHKSGHDPCICLTCQRERTEVLHEIVDELKGHTGEEIPVDPYDQTALTDTGVTGG